MQEQANRNDIQLRRVRRDDWDWIQEWFQDDWLNNELGPLDETWLEDVLGENDGVELIVEEHGNPVAIIGILWDTNKNPLNVVTSIAVNPNLRRRGIGRRILPRAMAWQGLPSTSEWIAYVSKENEVASSFFKSLEWEEDGIENMMIRYKFEVL